MTKALTKQQEAAAYTTGAHLCVDAGAGSGKTTVLVERIMHFLDRGVELRRIVAITFTRKAAGEMKERLREAIHHHPENDSRSMDKWRALELDVESARITTIDAFCASLLHENALRIGLDPNFTTLGDEEAPLLRTEMAETTLISLLDGGDATAHRLVVEHGLDKVTKFLSDSLNQTARFEEAAKVYAELDTPSLIKLWKAQAETLQKSRYEALAASPDLLRITSILSSLAGECSDAADKCETLRRDTLRFVDMLRDPGNIGSIRKGIAGLGELDLRGGSAKSWSSKDAMARVKAAADEARDLAAEYKEPEYLPEIEAAAAQLTLDMIAVFTKTLGNYREAKTARTALDFADLLTLTVRMLREKPELRARVAGGISHLLIDEFQDTNRAQLDLATLLAEECHAELFVVGDAKQSVYRFRGAEVDVFAQAKQWTHQTLRLDENFRSIAPLIAFINDFFHTSRLLARVEPGFHHLTAARNDAPAGPCIEFLIPETEDLSGGDDGEAPADSRSREAELVAGRIAELCGPSGTQVYDKVLKTWRPAQFADIAILYRAGTHAEVYESALRDRGIPANVIAGTGFYARQEILDLHNLFSAALDPWNEPALAAFLRSPFAGVTDDTLMRLTRNATLAAAFRDDMRTGDETEDEILVRAKSILEFVQQRREWPVPALLRDLLANTGFEAVLLSQYHGVQKAGNVHKLIDLARGFGGAGRLGLHAFTQHLSSLARNGLRAGDAELLAAANGAVTLMNVHKAKGLEFPIVVIVEIGRAESAGGQTPLCLVDPRHGLAMPTHDDRGGTAWPSLGQHLIRLDKEDDRAEEARVLYVAMTRARDRLLLAGPAKPKKNSWMAAMNATFTLGERQHDATLRSSAWEARVVRQATDSQESTLHSSTPPMPAIEPLLQQAEALPRRIAADHVIPVRTLLELMHPDQELNLKASALKNDALDRRVLGTAAHALLERWNFAGEPPIAEVSHDFFPASAQNTVCMRELGVMIDRLRRSTLWPKLANIMNTRRELPFLFELGGVYLNGVMDMLIDEEVLIDYKLGAPAPGRSRRHETQLRIYAAAIRAAAGSVPRQAFLYYMDSGILATVDIQPAILDETLDRARTALSTHFTPIPDARTD